MSDVVIKTQKIIKVGNSYAVTLDKKFVDALGLSVNEPLIARYHQKSDMVSFAKSKTKSSDTGKGITPEFERWVEKTLEEDREAMEELANL